MKKIKTENKSVTLQTDVVEFIENLRKESGLSFSTQLNLIVKKVLNKSIESQEVTFTEIDS